MIHPTIVPTSFGAGRPLPSQAQVAPLIRWLRHARLATVMDEAAEQLAQGIPEDALWAASALTACRYVNNQAHNLLGFVSHAMIGAEDARQLAASQPRRTRHLLLLQSIYQTVMDLHDICFAPYELLSFWPHLDGSVEETAKLLRTDVRFGEYCRADHRFVGLAGALPHAALIDLLLDIGLEGITTDDHTLISPVLALGMLSLTGWEAGFDLLRWAIRYSSSFPLNRSPYARAVALLEHYGLQQGAPHTEFQPALVQPLRQALFALADRSYSPATAVAAAAHAACDMYLRVDPVPHADFDAISREVAPIHIGNALRLLREGLPYMAPRTQALAAIQAGSLLERGPSVLNAEFAFVPFVAARAYPYAEDVAHWAGQGPARLLASLHDALHAHDCRHVTALVQAYAEEQGDCQPLIALLTEVAATDNGTLMHNLKHLNSMVIEFNFDTHPDRWNFLIQAAKFVGWYAGLTTTAHRRADAALQAHLTY
jgi:EAL domain-containing protein (putative c-di-GMP-specific phosphodiesterase class I)